VQPLALSKALRSFAAVAALLPATAAADSIASRLSPEWRALATEVRTLDAALVHLPGIPVEDLGGTRPFLRVFKRPDTMDDLRVDFTIRLTWSEARPVDFVALVPARKIDTLGLDPNYGFPEDFTVSLIPPDGALKQLASFSAMSANPSHRGHPVIARTPAHPLARGIEIHITRVRQPRSRAPGLRFIALSEIFCYSGEHNLAANSTVEIASEEGTDLPSFWSSELLIDGVTPLGLPERPRPAGETGFIGWLSGSRLGADEGMSIMLDLGQPRRIDGLRLYPALRPSIGDFPGFGIPEHFRLRVSNHPVEPDARVVFDHTGSSTPDIGHNPHEFRFPRVEARYVSLEATRLWKPYPHYPAFLALSEMQLLDGNKVISSGAKVTVPDQTQPVAAQGELMWSPDSLTDDRGPAGLLIPRRYWLEDLDKRLAMETRRREATERMAHLERVWNRGTLATASTIGIIALGFASILPARYRRRERRRIRDIRLRIAGDLHDDVGSNLGGIQMLTAMAREKPDNHEELKTIQRVAAETVNSVRDIVWLLYPLETHRVPTIDHLRESAAILLDPLEWTLASDFRDWKLGDEDGRHLVLFFREVLHNVRRHANAHRVSIHASRENDLFVLTINDDGRGIPTDRLDQPSSLRALHQRADRLGGSVEILTGPERGTTVILRFAPRAPGSAPQPSFYPDFP
jgi:signal transduction histidine kinase